MLSCCLCTLLLAACTSSPTPEDAGQAYLTRAREALSQKDFNTARQEILRLRQEQPKAFEAREMGILLMDSIDLRQAQEDLRVADSMLMAAPKGRDNYQLKMQYEEATQKIKFFSRKLQHDQNRRTTY